ncbi:hypothetical protein FIU09_06310 [Stenotrophomonas maltophilia]|nr:hypothetical protein FIU09_06310 [Stenotrophomonas maltophilia]TPD78192.1 hypothetical protein FJN21_09650 [Stenotrophomonas maltophilia]TPD85802.1 hypothetical protein FJN20_04490 [Stenotrophomonas maltophilia]TPD88073.1 hypothetical protein FJN19_01195 [Stenotrophomonas maltophilia]
MQPAAICTSACCRSWPSVTFRCRPRPTSTSSATRRSRGCFAGLRPAPAVVPAAGRQLQQQQLISCGMAGWVRLREAP